MKIPVPQIRTPPTLLKRRSGLHGWGMFTLDQIRKNKRIIEYAGEKITIAESEKREAQYQAKGEIWCFRINRRWARDGNVQGNDARFINHGCKPNCYSMIIGHTVLICAGRNIEAGEELTYNYYTDGEGEIPCVCRSGCQNLL
tara:strand:- start:11983 stop:12411 length:429 start_codon:yes stop_codon:yes gene_type:complete